MTGDDGVRLGHTVGTFALASLMLFFGTQLSGLRAPNYCDTISPAHIFAIIAASAVVVPSATATRLPKGLRLAALGIPGAVALAILYQQAPMCASGAFSTMDPVVRDYWYVRVNEGMPVWHQKWAVALSLLGVPVAGAATLLFLGRSIAPDKKAQYAGLAVLLLSIRRCWRCWCSGPFRWRH